MTWTVDLENADENFECPIFDMPSKKGIYVMPVAQRSKPIKSKRAKESKTSALN